VRAGEIGEDEKEMTGYISHKKIKVAGVPQFSGVDAMLIPSDLAYYGINEDFVSCGRDTDQGGHLPPPGWTLRHTGAGSVVTCADLAGGWLTLQGGAANNDTVQITLGDATIPGGGAFLVADNREIWFEARLMHTMVGETNIGIGLIDPAAADYLADDGAAPPNVGTIGLFTLDIGHAGPCPAHRWYSVGRKAAAEAYGDTGIAIVAATPIILGFHISGIVAGALYVADFFVNRVQIPAAQQVFANIPLTNLMPFVAVKNGAVPENVMVDYIMCVQMR